MNMSNNENLPIIIRYAAQTEHNFVYNSWIRSGYRSTSMALVPREVYTLNQHDIITHHLARSTVIVAHQHDAPENIFGYLCYQMLDGVFVMHYAYVKQTFRKLGVFSALLRAANFNPQNSAGFYTHSTKAIQHIERRYNLIYNPFLLSNPKYDVLVSNPKNKVLPAINTNHINDLGRD